MRNQSDGPGRQDIQVRLQELSGGILQFERKIRRQGLEWRGFTRVETLPLGTGIR